MKNWPELMINGIALYLLGKEAVDTTAANNVWKTLYEAKVAELASVKEEITMAREHVVQMHNELVSLMASVRGQEEQYTGLYCSHVELIEMARKAGLDVSAYADVGDDSES